ncbi:peptide ABC transporter substrate-binding protein [Sporosarcina luteola]|uniref:Peptide ABC transporter substrate-binding protein n=1 Tax=Sporosarcina luteola TaxID=582850 RepID=A0A511Z370_9BACL|nr:ABC transporter substrate-binding protein [Sporosarcina luteola]GEN81889.1 peptide ABC transporter substrate-binding protein [Sporosarcina luteola]
MRKRVFVSVVFSLLLAVFVAGCSDASNSNSGGDGENVLIVRATGDPMSFNPDTTADDNAYPIVQNLFNRLVKLDASKQIIPDLAKDWDVSEDGLTITFNLKENAKWHDGEPVTSKDVKYTFETIQENKTYYFSSRSEIVDTIETPDEHTVVFNMKSPDVSFIADLGWYATFILPEHVFNTDVSWDDNAASKEPIGSGPFKFGEFKQGVNVTLLPNEDYHDGKPKIDKLVFSIIPDEQTAIQALVNGEIDVFENVPSSSVEQLKSRDNVRLELNEYPSPARIIFNLTKEEVSDVNLRKAIATAIDKEEISTKVYSGIQKPEYSMYPSLIDWAANTEETSPEFNLEKAEQILIDAGYEKDANGFYVSGIPLEVFEGSGYPDMANLMKATLAKAGIGIDVKVSEFNAWNQKVSVDQNFVMELQGGFMGPDPAALEKRYGTDVGSNYGKYSNTKFDELTKKAGSTGDQELRAQYYKEAQAILAEDLPFIPIVTFAGYDANNSSFTNLPIDGTGKWGWAEYTFTERK